MKLSKWAKQKGIAYKTAHKWFQKGAIEGAYQERNGSIFVEEKMDLSDAEKKLEAIWAIMNGDRQ